MSIGEDFAASLANADVRKARAARVQFLGGLNLAQLEREEEKEQAQGAYDEPTKGLYRVLKEQRARQEAETLRALEQPDVILTQYARGLRDGQYSEKFLPVVQQLWTDQYRKLATRSALEKGAALASGFVSGVAEAIPVIGRGVGAAAAVGSDLGPAAVATGAAAAELGGAQSMRLLRGIPRLAEEDVTEEGLKKIFERDLKELSDIEGVRRYEGKFLRDMAAKAPGLAQAADTIRATLTPEDLETVDDLSNIFDPTEMLPIGFVVTKVGKAFGLSARAGGKSHVMARTFKTAADAAAEAEKLNSTFNKVRKAVGGAMQRTGERVAASTAGAPVTTFVGGLAAGLPPETAFVAAAVSSYLPRGVRTAAGQGLAAAGRTLAKDLPVPLERSRQGLVRAARQGVEDGVEGLMGNAIFALGASTPEEAGGLLGVGAGLGAGTGITTEGTGKALGLLDLTANRFNPAERPAETTRRQATKYNEGLDDIHNEAVAKLDNASANAIEDMRNTLVGPEGRLYIVDTPEQAARIASYYTGTEVSPASVESNGFSYLPEQTRQGVGVAVVFSKGEAFAHEPGHLVMRSMEVSSDPKIRALAAEAKQVANRVLPQGSERFAQVRDYYNSLLPEGAKPIDGDRVIEEFIVEHFTTAVGGAPLIKFGGDMPLSKKIYDIALTLAEKAGAYQSGLDLSGRSPVSSKSLPIRPSPQLAKVVENMLAARQLDLSKNVPSTLVNAAVPSAPPAGVQNVEAVIPPPQPPGFKKGDPIGNITDPEGKLVFTGAKVWADAQGPNVRVEGVDQQGKLVRADVPRAWLESGRATATPPVDVGTQVPVPADLTGRPATTPQVAPQTAGQVAGQVPQAPVPTVANVTEQQRQTVAGVATPALQAQNEQILTQNLNRPVEVEYSSAVASEESGDAAVRLRERQLADRNEQEGVPNPFRAVYGKVVVPTSIFTTGAGKRNIFGFSPDKLIRNIDQLRGWYLERGDKAAADRLYSEEFQGKVRAYLENQANGYRGDGARIARPAGTDPALYPAENPAYTPVPLSEADRNLVNFLMGLDPVSPTSLAGQWVMRLAELNGFRPASFVPGRAGTQKPVYNPLTQQLRDAGFDGKLNSAIEQLRIERMLNVAQPRPDLAAIRPPAQGSVQAGFMPEAAKEPMSVLRGRAQSLRHGAVITDYVKALVAADNATFMKELDATQTSLLADIANHYQLPVDPSKGGRLGVLSAVRKELAFQRKRAAKPAAPQLVNVGLKIGDKVALTEQDVIKAFADEGLTLTNVELRESGTEPTVIASVANADKTKVYRIAEKLGQDAIALYNPVSDAGILVGPRTENFGGKFLKEYFLMPEAEQAFMPAPPVESEAFKRWSGGKPVFRAEDIDTTNPPRRGVFEVYHGTKEDVTEFKAKYPDGLIFTTPDPKFAGEWGQNRNLDGRSPRNYPKDVEAGDKARADALRPADDAQMPEWEKYFDTPEYREPRRAKGAADTNVMKLFANVEKAFDPRKDYKVVEPLLKTLPGYEGIVAKGSHKVGNWIVYENKAVVDLLKSKGYDAMWLKESALDDKHDTLAVFSPNQLKSATGNKGTFDPNNPDIRYMPNRKPLKGSLGKGSIKFFHYSDTPNKGKIDPKYFGRSGLTGSREQAGLPRAFAYAEGSALGQDAGLVDARRHYYEGEAPKGQIYDGVEDALDYAAETNRAKADQKLIDKGFIGIYREGVDGRKQIEFFQPMSVVEAEKPETPPALAEEAMPILEPLALEEIDYAAQDREFARKKAAGEPLYMPKARGITSQLEATLQAIPEKASRQQIEAALRDGVKERGQLVERPVKAEEMRDIVDQTGRSFEDFLKENPSASRQEMLDFVRQNQIQVLEERLGRFGKAAEHTEEEWVRMSEEWEEAGKRAQERGDTEAANRFFTRSEQAARYAEGLDDAGSAGGTPKFERYTLPGGERYREIIYTTPEQGPTFTRDDLTHDTEGLSAREQALYWVIKGPDNTYIIPKKEYKTLDAAMEHVVRTKQPHSTGFKSQHFENVPNYLAHARVNDRVVPFDQARIDAIGQKLAAGMKARSVDSLASGAPEAGVARGIITEQEAIALSRAEGWRNKYHDSVKPEGETMLFAEEIQSDLHQKARTEGYREALTLDEENALLEQQMALNREYAAAVKSDNVPEMERLEAEKQRLRDRFKRAKSGIPDAPFKKSWHEFVFKNLLRDAAEQGKDWLGWTTGDQQAARYDLSKQIAKVQVMPSVTEGRERLWAYDHAGKMVLNQQIDAGTADQYIGKEVAKKLYEAPEKTFRDALMDEDRTYREVSGIDLKVGGEGMRGFYDDILPRFVDKYLKRYGIKTETVSVPDAGDVHAIRITPELRKDVLEKGQPAYMPAPVGFTTKPVSVEEAARLAEAVERTGQYQEEEFFKKVWPSFLKMTGNPLPASKKNFIKAAEQAVSDVTRFLKENPRFLDYYHKDWQSTAEILRSRFPDMTPEDLTAFQIFAGLTSPSTKLPDNIVDAVNTFNQWKQDGSLESIRLAINPATGNRMMGSSPFTFRSTTGATKAFSLKAIDGLFKEHGVTKTADLLKEPVDVKELQAFRKSLGYLSPVSDLGPIRQVVMTATGQDTLIPRAFVFGQKVGAYTLNMMGEDQYTTTDIWESRFIRSYFRGMFRENFGLPVNVDEQKIFQQFSAAFGDAFEKQFGERLSPSALQAVRWFYILDAARRSGYRNAKTNDSISNYTIRALQHLDRRNPTAGRLGDEQVGGGPLEGAALVEPVAE